MSKVKKPIAVIANNTVLDGEVNEEGNVSWGVGKTFGEFTYKGLKEARIYSHVQELQLPGEEHSYMRSNVSEPLNIVDQRREKGIPEGGRDSTNHISSPGDPFNEYVVGGNLFACEFVKSNLQELQGKILTFLEATTDNESKLKASKDIVRSMFRDKQNEFDELAWGALHY